MSSSNETKTPAHANGVPKHKRFYSMGNQQFNNLGRQSSVKGFLESLEATVSPSTARHRRVVSTLPANVHGLPETTQTKRDAQERIEKMKKFKSANYDPPESDLFRLAELNRSESDYSREESWRWIIAVLIGVAVGITAFSVNWAIDGLTNLKFLVTIRAIRSSGGFWGPYIVYMTFCLFYAALAGAIVSYNEPLAAGSGIPELKTYLNGVHIRGLLTVRAFCCKMSGIMFTISAGLIAGKVGPFVHAGGIIGGGVGQMGSRFFSKFFGSRVAAKRENGGYFRSEYDHRDFVAVGTGAGIACAFGAPIGGLLFTIEESASFYSTSFFWRGFLATCVGTTVVNILEGFKPGQVLNILSNKVGVSRDFGPYNVDSGQFTFFFYLWETPAFIVLGMLGGLFGALFIRLNVFVLKWRQKNIPATEPTKRVLEVIFICFVTQSVWFLICFASRCKPLPPGVDESSTVYKYLPQLWCPKGEYKPYGTLFYSSLANALRLMCHFEDFQAGIPLLYFVLALGFMTWTFGVGAATGLFITSLVVGAAMGRWYGKILQILVANLAPDFKISLPGYAVVGAAAMLSGTTRMTLSISVLVMETTGSLGMIVPIMLGVFFAKYTGDKLGLSVHDTQIKLRGAPVLPESGLKQQQKMVHMKLSARDVMQTKVRHLNPVMRIKDLVDVLKACEHEVFPVTWAADKSEAGHSLPFELIGVIERHTILRMLKFRVGFTPMAPSQVVDFFDPTYDPKVFEQTRPPVLSQEERLQAIEKLQQYPEKVRMEEQGGIFRSIPLLEQESTTVDFRPFMQKSAFVVPEDVTLFRAYRLFRMMGLRYLFVTPSRPQVIGIITRKDLTEENAQLCLLNNALQRGIISEDFLQDDPDVDLTLEMQRLWKDIVEKPLSKLPFIDYLEALASFRKGGRQTDENGMTKELSRPSGVGSSGSRDQRDRPSASVVEMTMVREEDEEQVLSAIESLQAQLQAPRRDGREKDALEREGTVRIRELERSRSASPAPGPSVPKTVTSAANRYPAQRPQNVPPLRLDNTNDITQGGATGLPSAMGGATSATQDFDAITGAANDLAFGGGSAAGFKG